VLARFRSAPSWNCRATNQVGRGGRGHKVSLASAMKAGGALATWDIEEGLKAGELGHCRRALKKRGGATWRPKPYNAAGLAKKD